MKKRSWRGADLLRSDVSTPVPPSTPSPASESDPKSKLGRIRTRKIIRGPNGEIMELNPTTTVWLVQMDGINQLLMSDALTSIGLAVEVCELLHELPQKLGETESIPKLIVLEARAVGQQTPFFRKMILPLLEDVQIPCLIVGVTNQVQEQLFRSWYNGPLMLGGELAQFTATVQTLTQNS